MGKLIRVPEVSLGHCMKSSLLNLLGQSMKINKEGHKFINSRDCLLLAGPHS